MPPTPRVVPAARQIVTARPTPVVVKREINSDTPKPVAVKPTKEKTVIPVVTATPAPVVATTSAPAVAPRARETATPQQAGGGNRQPFNTADYQKADFVGDPINLDLRSTQGKIVDIRDFLRFISDTYKVNFVLDQSVKDVPITVSLQSVPWNKAMEAILKANRLGIKVDGNILRVLTQEAFTQEDKFMARHTC